MKRIFILVSLALLIFALPAIASPPVALPDLEALGPAFGTYLASQVAPEVAPVAIDSGGPVLVANYFDLVQAREGILDLYVSPGTAPTLAGLERGIVLSPKTGSLFVMSAYHYDPRDRLQALARDQTAALT